MKKVQCILVLGALICMARLVFFLKGEECGGSGVMATSGDMCEGKM